MKEIASIALGRVIDFLPGFLIRVLLPPRKQASRILIDLRGDSPINCILDGQLPRLDLWFAITNHTPLRLILDRLIADVWFGQPTFERALLVRQLVPPNSTVTDLLMRCELSAGQAARIAPYAQTPAPAPPITFHLTAYFHSKVGLLEVETRIERREV